MKNTIALQNIINPEDYSVGVIVARFQLHKLHEGQKEMIDFVLSHHKKVILFLRMVNHLKYVEVKQWNFAE